MTTLRNVKCNHCDWQGDESELIHTPDVIDPDIATDSCPRCTLADALIEVTPQV